MGLLAKIEQLEKERLERLNQKSNESFEELQNTPILELEGMEENTTNQLFSQWAKKNGFSQCGVFLESYGYFVMCDMLGFHAQTAITSVSSSDFWMGSLERTTEWEVFTEDDMNISPFYQLFSDDDRYEVKKLCFLPKNILGQNIIIFFASDDEFKRINLPSPQDETFLEAVKQSCAEFKSPFTNKQLIEKHLKEGFLRYEASCFTLSVKIAIDNIVSQCETENSDIRQTIYDTIYTLISDKIQQHFAYPNSVTKGIEGEIKILIFANGKVEEDLLRMQLDETLKSVLAADSQGVILTGSGNAATIEDARNFLF